MMMLLLALRLLLPSPSDLSLRHADDRWYLVWKGYGSRQVWPEAESTVVPLPDGRRLVYSPDIAHGGGELVLQSGSTVLQTVSMRELLSAWLPRDSAWGPDHQDANDVRYGLNKASDLVAYLGSPTVVGHDVWAVIGWHFYGDTGSPIIAANLVRIHPGRTLTVEPVAGLPYYNFPSETPSIYRTRRRLFVYALGQQVHLYTLDVAAARLHEIGTWEDYKWGDNAQGLCGQRYLVLWGGKLTYYDLDDPHPKPQHVRGKWTGDEFCQCDVPPQGNSIVLEPGEDRPASIVHLPDGADISLGVKHLDRILDWQRMVITVSGDRVTCFDLATGSKLKSFKR